MKKLSRTFYLVSLILCIVELVTAVGTMVASPLVCQYLIDNSYIPCTLESGLKVTVNLAWAYVIILEVALAFDLVLTIFVLIFAVKARKEPTKKLNILSIIFGALTGEIFSVVAGILGVVASKKE